MIFFFSNTAHPPFFSNEDLCEMSQYIKQIDGGIALAMSRRRELLAFFIFPCCSRDIFTELCLSFQSPYFPKHPNLQTYWTIWRLLYHTLSHFFAAAAQCSFICLSQLSPLLLSSSTTSQPIFPFIISSHFVPLLSHLLH